MTLLIRARRVTSEGSAEADKISFSATISACVKGDQRGLQCSWFIRPRHAIDPFSIWCCRKMIERNHLLRSMEFKIKIKKITSCNLPEKLSPHASPELNVEASQCGFAISSLQQATLNERGRKGSAELIASMDLLEITLIFSSMYGPPVCFVSSSFGTSDVRLQIADF